MKQTFKVFISQPMKGLTNEEIEAKRTQLIAKVMHDYPNAEILDSFFKDAPVEAKPLWFLGKSLELLSTADLAVFAKGYENARGCSIEHYCAIQYGIETIEE